MRYVIVTVVKGKAGNFNNSLREDIFTKFGAKSSKLPAHFTIKSPFEADDISILDSVLSKFCTENISVPYNIKGYDYFDNRVIFMKVLMSREGKLLHNKLIDALDTIDYINFNSHDGKDKIFHITISSKKIQPIFNDLWEYVNNINCHFDATFDNISVFKWCDNTWILHKEYII
ncbi:MAG: 2'-5' RNA ligase family protein [Romboutsia sp.]